MSTMRDGPILKAVSDVIKSQVSALHSRIGELERRIKDAPKPENGKDGRDGIDGKDGVAGRDGERGSDGAQGAKGEQGQKGLDGAAGKDGLNGKDGRDGINGKDGTQGLNGNDGKDGADGLVGKDGRDGINGKDGTNGLNGKDAEPIDAKALADEIRMKIMADLPTIVMVEVTKAVAAIPSPANGRDGRDGRKGDAGLPGKDAADIDWMPGIDESMAYPKGACAVHKGGSIIAYRTTDPVVDGDLESAGWLIAQNGIQNIVEDMAGDGRTRITSYVMTNGKSIVTKVKTYQQIPRGTFVEGKEYDRGDVVTWDGSSWHAEKDTRDKPGRSDSWRLMVKKGDTPRTRTIQ